MGVVVAAKVEALAEGADRGFACRIGGQRVAMAPCFGEHGGVLPVAEWLVCVDCGGAISVAVHARPNALAGMVLMFHQRCAVLARCSPGSVYACANACYM